MKKQLYFFVYFFCMLLSSSIMAQTIQIDSTKWVSNGPHTAFITCLEIAPSNSNVMYLGTYAGKIYKSTDGGENWAPCATEGLDDMRNYVGPPHNIYLNQNFWDGDYSMVLLIKVDPLDENHVWLAPVSGSLYETKDGGNTWQKTDDSLPADCYYIQTLDINPENPNEMFAGTSFCGDSLPSTGLYRTLNGGADWERIELSSEAWLNREVNSILRDPNNNNHLLVCFNHTLWETFDNGDTWNVLLDQSEGVRRVHNVVMNPHNSSQLFGIIESGYMIYYFMQSDDGGRTWYRPESNLGNVDCYQIYADADFNLYLAQRGDTELRFTILKSTDLGKTWAPIDKLVNRSSEYGFMALTHTCKAVPENTNKLFIGTHFGLYVSNDGGETLTLHNNGLDNAYIQDIEVNPKNRNIMYACSFQGLWKTEDGGESWKTLLSDHPIHTITCDPLYPDTIYTGGEGLWRSYDGGETFEVLETEEDEMITGLSVHPQKTNIIFKLSSEGKCRSTDRGETWIKKDAKVFHAWSQEIIFDPNHPDTMYFYNSRSYDEGENWSVFDYPLDFELRPDRIVAVHPTASNILYNKTIKPKDAIAISYDYGYTYELLADFPDYYVSSHLKKSFHIDSSHPDMLFYSNAMEDLYYSDNGGESWAQIPGNYNVRVTEMNTDMSKNQIILATHGSGVWTYKDTDDIPEYKPTLKNKINVYPNPFTQETHIEYELKQSSKVILEVSNINGQKVHTLVEEVQPKGKHHITWNGRMQNGQQGTPGLYLIRLQTGDDVVMQKVLLVK